MEDNNIFETEIEVSVSENAPLTDTEATVDSSENVTDSEPISNQEIPDFGMPDEKNDEGITIEDEYRYPKLELPEDNYPEATVDSKKGLRNFVIILQVDTVTVQCLFHLNGHLLGHLH